MGSLFVYDLRFNTYSCWCFQIEIAEQLTLVKSRLLFRFRVTILRCVTTRITAVNVTCQSKLTNRFFII